MIEQRNSADWFVRFSSLITNETPIVFRSFGESYCEDPALVSTLLQSVQSPTNGCPSTSSHLRSSLTHVLRFSWSSFTFPFFLAEAKSFPYRFWLPGHHPSVLHSVQLVALRPSLSRGVVTVSSMTASPCPAPVMNHRDDEPLEPRFPHQHWLWTRLCFCMCR